MRQITSLFAHKVAAIIEPGLNKAQFLEELGLDSDAPINPSVMISDTEYYTFLENISRTEQSGHTLSLRAGNAMCCDDYGAFGLAWKSAASLRGSLTRAERYSRVLTNVSTYSVELSEKGAFAHLHREGNRRLGLRLSNEATVASIYTICKEVSTYPVELLAVYFRHQAPEVTHDHEEFFGCPVHFNTDRDALLIAHESLQNPNKVGDPTIVKFFDKHLEDELANIKDDSVLVYKVKTYLSQALSEGIPTISDVAEKLAMSGRTLQRKLSDQGITYQSVVDDARRELSERLLTNSNHSLADIAFLTGFSEQSSFNRAFKRWAGQTPRSYRLAAKSK
ncbi:MAG: AraC family transcriptional regulator [Gammaproteobacteria bacterium]|nr:AraC family transcriptional regulator [Gammaproteobacteria bacterium]MAY03913.1 AraC family transcriptional regulator [Gammaproteobacteria bacterium]|tara:strand:+ start:254 stop:1261 length:1008 start_codon:yes stop_codon:yes gene_type:complete